MACHLSIALLLVAMMFPTTHHAAASAKPGPRAIPVSPWHRASQDIPTSLLTPASESETKKFKSMLREHQLPDGELSPSSQAAKKRQLAKRALITMTLKEALPNDLLKLVLAYTRGINYITRIQRWPLRGDMTSDRSEITAVDDNGAVSIVTFKEDIFDRSPFANKIVLGPQEDALQVSTLSLDALRYSVPIDLGFKNTFNNHTPVTDAQDGLTRILSIADGYTVGRPFPMWKIGRPVGGGYKYVAAIAHDGSYALVAQCDAAYNNWAWYSVSTSTGKIVPLLKQDDRNFATGGLYLVPRRSPHSAIIDGTMVNLDTGSVKGRLPQDYSPFYFDAKNRAWYLLKNGFIASTLGSEDVFKNIPEVRETVYGKGELIHVNYPEHGYSLTISDTLKRTGKKHLYLLQSPAPGQLTTPPPLELFSASRSGTDDPLPPVDLPAALSDNGTKCALKTKDAILVFHLDGCD